MKEQDISKVIAKEMQIQVWQVENASNLFDGGDTIPFVARYRKEKTGELDEEQLRNLSERLQYLRNLVKRQEEIRKSIEEQGKLTPEIDSAIEKAVKMQELEDIYLPFKPKKRTRAMIARENGLEPLANLALAQEKTEESLEKIAEAYLNEKITTVEEALNGARDIIAEVVSERTDIRNIVRNALWQRGKIYTDLISEEEKTQAFLMYKEKEELLKFTKHHRVLAINRGEKLGVLKVTLLLDHDEVIAGIVKKMIKQESIFTGMIGEAIADGYKRLLFPSIEREIRSQMTENAEKQAIKVFALNLRQRLLEAPLAGFNVLGLDPGYRTGCKMAVVNKEGKVLQTGVMYLMSDNTDKAEKTFLKMVKDCDVNLISIGNGTASYETEVFTAKMIEKHQLDAHYLIVSEAGASVYSASKLAREELPDLDVSLRGAVSIARRVQDPLAELVKIDPKSIGVGQYQHDVNQKQLKESLGDVVESAVNSVGVELNTASPALLNYVAGVSASVAKNIVAYRDEMGSFTNRKELLKVTRLGKSAFTQCAGFLRIKDSTNPLDNTPIHPESYELTEKLISSLGFASKDLQDKDKMISLQEALKNVDSKQMADELEAGEPTVRDIIAALLKPGRDPRDELPKPMTRKNIVQLSDIKAGSMVKGTVQNVTDFGAFVDFGIKTNGLIHISEMSVKRIQHPLDVVSVGQIVDCLVLEVDEKRNRIALSLKQVPTSN